MIMQTEDAEDALLNELLAEVANLVKLLNDDEAAAQHQKSYTAIYNLLITVLTSQPTKGGALDLINGIIETLLLSPVEDQY